MVRDYGCVRNQSGQVLSLRDDTTEGGVMLGFQSDDAFVVILRLSIPEAGRLRVALAQATGADEEVRW